MPKATLISPISKQGIQLLRVAAYCRVSSSSADQLNSYATQIEYYTNLAKKKKSEWNMVEIFQEENLTPAEAKALYREKHPLDRMYQEWLDTDVSEMQMLKDSIDDTAKKAVKEMKDKQKESR